LYFPSSSRTHFWDDQIVRFACLVKEPLAKLSKRLTLRLISVLLSRLSVPSKSIVRQAVSKFGSCKSSRNVTQPIGSSCSFPVTCCQDPQLISSFFSKCIHLLNWFDYRNHICLVSELLGICVYDFLKENDFAPFPRDHIQSFAQQLLGSVACTRFTLCRLMPSTADISYLS